MEPLLARHSDKTSALTSLCGGQIAFSCQPAIGKAKYLLTMIVVEIKISWSTLSANAAIQDSHSKISFVVFRVLQLTQNPWCGYQWPQFMGQN